MPASEEMESSFYAARPWRFKERRSAIAEVLRAISNRPSLLMHAGGYTVAAVGLHGSRAAAECAENHDRGDEGE
jgi:hypothetical protein